MDKAKKASLLQAEGNLSLAAKALKEMAYSLIPAGTQVSFVRRRLDTEYRIYGEVAGYGVDRGYLEIRVTTRTGAQHTASLSDFCGFRIED